MVKFQTLSEEDFTSKVDGLWEILRSCSLCGWNCGFDRIEGQKGKCQAGLKLKISSTGPHYGEEPPLVGHGGSGTIFLTHCSVNCVYCQNWTISQAGRGHTKGFNEVADIMLRLQKQGCHNINWVTPTHFAPQLVKALKMAKDQGLSIPIVYNTGGYDSVATVEKLDGIVDIYMPDMKYGSNEMAQKYSKVPNYWDINKEIVNVMHQQVGDLQVNDEGIAERGLLIRHLVLPHDLAKSQEVIRFIAEELSKNTYVNIMGQYRPCYNANEYAELNRMVRYEEVERVKRYARNLGLHRGF
ncbi:MAG: radical SAM protein [Candidatus Korarchaeota archaeon]|nr:radical SAM protein [Candidatus Korarchaeota archaeon]NIU83594.1 radical SAM protein [Candidatus Thorarchaeota archaeon]NIW13839.1 radical SAM protein [Candidatus Thorarchaeota archaeon]